MTASYRPVPAIDVPLGLGRRSAVQAPDAAAARPTSTPPAPVISVGELPETEAVAHFARLLAGDLDQGVGRTVTWLNHHSALMALRAGVPLDQFDYLGVDGIFLGRMVKATGARTSADLLLPELLARKRGLRIALVGSSTQTLEAVAAKATAEFSHDVVLMRDGFAGLPTPEELRADLVAVGAQLVIIGLGAPLQDTYALALKTPGLLVLTCGGWLDQYSGAGSYYPAWAYPLRLNWLVRLAREPKRLWRRYTIDAVRALRVRAKLVDYVTGLGAQPLAAVTSGALTLPRVSAV